MMSATFKQDQLLGLIKTYVSARGIAPSFEELRTQLQVRSKSNIHRMVLGLEERGLIRRLPNRARAIEIVTNDNRQTNPVSHDAALAAIFRPEQLDWIKAQATRERLSPCAFLRDMIETCREVDA